MEGEKHKNQRMPAPSQGVSTSGQGNTGQHGEQKLGENWVGQLCFAATATIENGCF